MASEHKPQASAEHPHMEKQVLPEPMEEFVADQSVPSKSMSSSQGKESSGSQGPFDIKPAGHQDNKPETFDPGTEG